MSTTQVLVPKPQLFFFVFNLEMNPSLTGFLGRSDEPVEPLKN